MMLKLLSFEFGGLLAVVFVSTFVYGASNFTSLSIRMPDASPTKDNAYLCTSIKISAKDQHIVGFDPKTHQNVAHHMLLFGCDKPGSWRSTWDCSNGLECANNENILFAWANGATAKTLPKDVGFQIGKKAGIRYLVLQVHYKHKAKDLQTDDSGFVLHVTPQRQPYLAGIYLMWSGDVDIPPESKGVHSDIVCQYRDETPMYAFAFRTHAHGLGRVITGYKVNHNNWTLLGRGDPKEPQAFYPMDGIHKISKGDTLAARCTYDSKGHHLHNHVQIGPTSDDEMCNFYIMYYRDSNKPDLDTTACDDKLAHTRKLKFPADSDTPLKKPSQHSSTDTDLITDNMETGKEMDGKESSKESRPSGEKSLDLFNTDRKHSEMGHKDSINPSEPNNGKSQTSDIDEAENKNSKEIVDDRKMTSTDLDNTDVDSSSDDKGIPKASPSMIHKEKPQSNEYQIDKSWPQLGDEKLGQVAGVAMDSKGNVLVFHRGSRKWDQTSFDNDNIFIEDHRIPEHTVLTLDPKTGKIIGRWGNNMFYLPHGITVDHHDNIWLTDVAMHQVYKYRSYGGSRPLLIVGEKFVPGSDHRHLCKPTDVAVERSGDFFISDGYCNNRIMKFSSEGIFLEEWGTSGSHRGELNLPHSLSLDESHHHLYIADRQNSRVQVLHTTRGIFLPAIKKEHFHAIFAVDFNLYAGHLHVLEGVTTERVRAKGYTLKDDHIIETWPSEKQLFVQPHDVISSTDDVNLYVTEIGPNRIWKLTKSEAHKTSHYPAFCSLGKETGPCRAAMPRWYFNMDKQTCQHFIYGGCSGNQNNFQSRRECETKCSWNGNSNSTGRASELHLQDLGVPGNTKTPSQPVNISANPTEKVTDDWQNASGEDEGNESNIYYSTHYNHSSNHTGHGDANKDESKDDEEIMGGMIPALVILSVLAVPIVFLLLISIALRIRAYRRDTRYKSNRLLKTDKEGLAVGRTRGWLSYMNCCNRQNYGFDKVNLAEFYSDSDSEGV